MSSLTLLRALSCIILLSGLLEAKSLKEVKNVEAVSIDSAQAHGFLSQARSRRNVDPKWHRGTPDFQSYYRFYTSIGHIEGLYEIDKIRMLYQQMRHLEQTYGADASSYQNALGVQTTTPPPTTTTQAPPPPTTQPPPPVFTDADIIHLCNPKDPLCKPKIVYLPTGAVPVLCDPRYHPACQPKSDKEVPEAPEAPEEPAIEASPPPPPPPQKSAPAPEISFKGMEYDCDPYWDPDCLIDHPPRPVETTSLPPPPPTQPPPPVEEKVKEEEPASAVLEEKTEAPSLQFDPYDYRRDLFNPYLYTNPAPEEQ